MTRSRFHVVQVWGSPGDYHAAMRVGTFDTIEAAYQYIDRTADRLAKFNLTFDEAKLDLVVVNEAREVVPRPKKGLQ